MGQTAKHIDTITIGTQFIGAIFNGDLTGLDANEEYLITSELDFQRGEAEEQFGEDLTSVVFECTSSERYICKCDLVKLLSECVEVKVVALVNEKA